MPSWKRLLLVAAVVSLTATAALAILVLLLGDFGEVELRILGTTGAISVASLLALPGGILVERRLVPALGWATVALAVATFGLVVLLLWEIADSDGAAKLAGTAAAFAGASTQTAALVTRRRRGDSRAVSALFLATSALAVLVAAAVAAAIWIEIDSEGFYRALGALVVLDVFLVLLQPLLRRFGAADDGRARVVLEGTPEQVDEALRRLEGTGVEIRRA